MAEKKPRVGILEEMTMPELVAFKPEVVVVPIGSTEPHGPHLPYCTDTLNARVVAEDGTVGAVAKGAKVLCYPTLPISLNTNVGGFPLALSLRVATFMNLLTDICEQIERFGVRKIVIVNGHGGNTSVLQAFLRDWCYKGVAGMKGAEDRAFVCALMIPFPQAAEMIKYPSIHAGEDETWDVMVTRPELVRKDKFKKFEAVTEKVKWLSCSNVMWVKPWHVFLPEGACGETRETTDEGQQKKAEDFVALNAKCLTDMLVEIAGTPWSDMFPYKK